MPDTIGRLSDPAHLLGATRISIQQGGNFLVHRIAPQGPILRERNLNYVHKATWGMHAAGVDHDVIARLLDWARDEALQANGDFYFPDETTAYRISQRLYRPITFGKVAAWIGHPVIRDERVVQRILQYQHLSGGVFHYIGEDPGNVEEQAAIGALNTSFFGHLMVALELKEPAIAAGDWLRRFVEANRTSMGQGVLYTQMTPDGDLLTDAQPGERITKLVDNVHPKQEFWQVGTAMAYLAVLYDTLRTRWGSTEADAQPYLDSALELSDFEATMPLQTYLWISKCKVAWGAGELLRVLVRYGMDADKIEQAYRLCERAAIFTFMDNQLPSGGWPCLHYPLSEEIPEMDLNYKPLKGTVAVPNEEIPGSKTIFLSGEEITGECVGEMKSVEMGLTELLKTGDDREVMNGS